MEQAFVNVSIYYFADIIAYLVRWVLNGKPVTKI